MRELIANGASRYQIVTPGRFTPAENHAVENLQEALYRMTGVRLPVRWAHQRLPERPAILVGSSEAAEPGLWDLEGAKNLYLRPEILRRFAPQDDRLAGTGHLCPCAVLDPIRLFVTLR